MAFLKLPYTLPCLLYKKCAFMARAFIQSLLTSATADMSELALMHNQWHANKVSEPYCLQARWRLQ